MASLITPPTAAATATATATANAKPLARVSSTSTTPITLPTSTAASAVSFPSRRRDFLSLSAFTLILSPISPAMADSDEDYLKETENVISKVRTTITLDKTDPNIATAVAELRETSNSWVAKFRKEKSLLARASFRDMYSALNAVSGHYISFGPTAPIPAKRRQRILEEVETAEKALLRGR